MTDAAAAAAAYELVVLKESFAVCRLPPAEPLPGWAGKGAFRTVSWTADELSVVCPDEQVPTEVTAERGFSCLQVVGPLVFDAVGVMASLTTALASAGISIFAISTFDTDYLLVRQRDLPDAIDALREAGQIVQF